MKLRLDKIILTIPVIIVFALTLFPISITYAVGPTVPTGPTKPVGPTSVVGPVQPVGPTVTTGPTTPTGPNEKVGPTVPTGPSSDNNLNNTSSNNTEEQSPTINQATSSDSESNSDSGQQTNSSLNVVNDAKINNNVEISLDSGTNSIGDNTVVNNFTTGSIEAAINLLNLANSNFAPGSTINNFSLQGSAMDLLLSAYSPDQIIDISNNTTGFGSDNINQYTNSNQIEVTNINNAEANNIIEVEANTGGNIISNNSKVGNITTGDINIGVNVINLLNILLPDLTFTMNIWNIFGGMSGDIILPDLLNTFAGTNSNNINSLTSNSQSTIDIEQQATIGNAQEISVNTGLNTFGNNTLAGNITSGNSSILSNETNISNIGTPIFYIFNVFGDWDNLESSDSCPGYLVNEINSDTGANSDNANSAATNNNSNISLRNNAKTNTSLLINANTGKNNIKNNTVLGSITTGTINISENVINIMNSFSKDVGKFALTVINIFGNWHGNPRNTAKNNDNNPPKPTDMEIDLPVVTTSSNTTISTNEPASSNHIAEDIDAISQTASKLSASYTTVSAAILASNDRTVGTKSNSNIPDTRNLVLGESANHNRKINALIIELIALITGGILAYGGYKFSQMK